MMPRSFHLRLFIGTLALAATAGAIACTLNPQPLPPGFTDSNGAPGGGKADDDGGPDTTGTVPSDAGMAPAAPDDGGVFGSDDGGPVDASSVTDGEAGVGDAGADALGDGSSDASDGGG